MFAPVLTLSLRSESQKLRNLGNQVYQKNRLSEALEYYSQSICLAPHPLPPNTYLNHPQEQEDTISYEVSLPERPGLTLPSRSLPWAMPTGPRCCSR